MAGLSSLIKKLGTVSTQQPPYQATSLASLSPVKWESSKVSVEVLVEYRCADQL